MVIFRHHREVVLECPVRIRGKINVVNFQPNWCPKLSPIFERNFPLCQIWIEGWQQRRQQLQVTAAIFYFKRHSCRIFFALARGRHNLRWLLQKNFGLLHWKTKTVDLVDSSSPWLMTERRILVVLTIWPRRSAGQRGFPKTKSHRFISRCTQKQNYKNKNEP